MGFRTRIKRLASQWSNDSLHFYHLFVSEIFKLLDIVAGSIRKCPYVLKLVWILDIRFLGRVFFSNAFDQKLLSHACALLRFLLEPIIGKLHSFFF